MRNAIVGVIVGAIIGVTLSMGYQDYKITKARISQVEQYLIQQQQRQIPRQVIKEPDNAK